MNHFLSMTSSPRISVIIAVFNGAKHLSAQMDALLAQRCDFPWEAICVDNGSTDTSRELISAHTSISDIFRQRVTYGRSNFSLYLELRKHRAQRPSLRAVTRGVKQTFQSLGGRFHTLRPYQGVFMFGILTGRLLQYLRSRTFYI